MKKTKVLIAGASGLIGQALLKHLKEADFDAIPLLRTQKDNLPFWDIEKKTIFI
jgi:nucleoside-diphosphate-sugar epimerase